MNDLLKDEDIWGAATAPESPTLSDADIWGGPSAPATSGQKLLSDADIWGGSTPPAMPQSGYRKEAGPLYDADNPPYAEDQFIKAKKIVNGKEYRLHGPTGVVYDENNRAVVAPDVLKAFGRDKPNKLAQSIYDANEAMKAQGVETAAPPVADRKIINGREYRAGKESGLVFDDKNKIVDDPQILQAFGIGQDPGLTDYAGEFGRSTVRGVAGAAASTGKGLNVLTSDNAAEIERVEQGIANLKNMSAEEATAFMRELPSKLSPAVAFNYQVAIRKLWKNDAEGAKPYLEQARKYIDTRPIEEQGLTVAGKKLEEATNKAFPQDPRFKGSITSDLGQAAGSSLFFLPIGLLTGGTGVAVAGAAAGASESYDTAKDDIANGDFREDRGGLFNAGYGTAAETAALGAGRLGAIPGASEVVPTEIFLEQMPKYIPGLRTIANTPAWGRFAKAFGRVGTQVLSEGGQEAFQTWAGNLINQLKINPSQDVTEDVLYNALLGGVVGGGMQTGVEGYNAVFGKDEPGPNNGGPINVSPAPGTPGGPRIDPTLFPGGAPQGQQAAPAPGSPPGAPPADMPIPDDAWLLGAGYTAEQIGDMNPEERAAAVEEAQAQGVEPIDFMAGAPQPGAAPMAPRGTRRDKVNVQSEQDLEAVRPTVNAEPSAAQAAAGNYQKGHVKLHGFDVSIENPRGSVRRGKDEDGKDWASPELPADYGYIKGTKGKDGDHVDVYIGPAPESDRVYVIDQHNLKSGEFDEHKAVLGATSPQEAVDLYVNSFDNPTYDRIGDVTEMSVDDFRQWVQNRRNTKKPAAAAGVGTVVQRPAPGTAPMAPRAPRPDPAAEAAATTAKLKAHGLTDEQIRDLSWEEVQRLAQTPPPAAADDFDSIFQQELDAEYGTTAPAPVAPAPTAAPKRKYGTPSPVSVLDFIASIGGISDPTGELKGMDLPKMTRFGPVLRKSGLHPDKVREALVERGFLTDRGFGTDLQASTTENDVYDLLAQHMGGQKVFAPEDQAKADAIATTRAAERQNPDFEGVHPIVLRWGQEVWDEVQAVLELQGLDEDAWSPQEVNDAARMISEGMDPEQAFERAYATHVAELDEMPEIAPEIAAAFEKNRANAMVVFDPPPFPDVETADNAAQQQDLPEAGDGLDADGEAGPDPRGEAEVRGAGPESAGAGPDGAEAGSAELTDEEVTRPRRNAIGSNALEDALLPNAREKLAEWFKKRNASRDLRRVREGMEVYQRLLDGGFAEEADELRKAANGMLNFGTPEWFAKFEDAVWTGLQTITGEEDPDPAELLENEVFATAADAGELIFQTLDPKTASFDVEEFNTAFGDVEFRRDKDKVFPPVKKQVRIWKDVGRNRISQDEADAEIAKWKEHARRIGREEDHSKEVILSLFDVTGQWSQPYRDAGYHVIQYDIKSGNDLMKFGDWMADVENEINEGDKTIVGILAAPPCTTFASSGARWWADVHDKADKKMIEKTFGKVWAADFFETPVEYANALVAVVKLIVEQADPKFYAMENPVGRIQSQNQLPDPLLAFDPNNFGNPYTKRTLLWGEFNTDLPTANVEPTLGSLIHKLRGDDPKQKAQRSETPDGFAYAFFMANNTSGLQLGEVAEPAAREKPSKKEVFKTAEPTKGPHEGDEGFDPTYDRLRQDGVHLLTWDLNIRVPEETSASRLFQFPLDYKIEKGGGYVYAPDQRLLERPAVKAWLEAHPYVEVKAAPKTESAFNPIWHHAVDLANQKGWKELIATREYIEDPDMVARAVEINLHGNSITIPAAERLMEEFGFTQPSDEVLEDVLRNKARASKLEKSYALNFDHDWKNPESDPSAADKAYAVMLGIRNGWLDNKRHLAVTKKGLEVIGKPKPGTPTPAPTTAAEKGADAKEQLVIPGAERDQKGALNNAAKAPLKGSVPQKGMDLGLFGSERDQTDMFDQPQPKKAEAKADTGLAQQIRDKFVIFSSGMSRLKDFLSGAYTTGTLSTRGIGVDVQELSDDQIKPMAKKIVEWQTQVFIDSGAFGVFKRNMKERVKYENALIDLFEREGAEAPELEEISDAQLLTRYDQIANALSKASEAEGEADYPQPLYVAPDVVGDQAGSIALVKKNAKWINLRLDGGRQIIVPIQKGEKNLAEAFEAVAEILGRRDFIVGVPSNAKAVTDAEFAAFVKAAKPPKLHFLGTTDPAKIEPRIEAIAAAGYVPEHVSSDANMLRALLYGRSDVTETRDEGIRRVIKDRSPEFGELAGSEPDEMFSDEYLTEQGRTDLFEDIWQQELDAAFDKKGKGAKSKERTAGQAAKSAAKNTAKGMGEIVQGLEALFGSKNKLSSGFTFDEESYAKALPLFKAAVSHLGEAVKDMREVVRALIRKFRENGMSREALEGMAPYLKRFGEDLTAGKISLEAEAPKAEEGGFHPLVVAFVDYLSQPDAGFDTITEARKFAKDRGFDAKPGTPEAKDLDEKLELAIVLTARTLVGASKKRPPKTAYRRLVDLYNRQPNLGVRTSESMADQAYSTPAPLAYIASRLAGVAGAKSVMEPTAGNGMLLIEADPKNATVNEINDRRAAALKAQGFRVSQLDAATERLRHKGYPVEAIIENPPFGAVKESDGGSKTFTVNGWNTTQIDHAIALHSLESLADNGRAVLIVGSVKEGTDKSRSDSYNTKQKREFYWRLYQAYNVTDHFTVSGDLYKRQGAGWPVDVIVIEGRGKSVRPLPAVELPKVYDTWESLEEKLDEAPAQTQPGTRPQDGGAEVSRPAGVRDVAEDGQRLEGGSTLDQPQDGGRGTSAVSAPARGEGSVPDGGNQRERADLGEQQLPEPDGGAVAPGERAERDGDRQPPVPGRERVKQDAEAAQQPYKPMSSQPALDTKIPTNMADAVETSLGDLSDRYGELDSWVEKELGYKKGEIGKYLAAEQVDAVALALDNVKKNAAFIIGDQTGIGKGRVVAAALRYAIRNKLVPIFVTEKPNLYGDIIRDLNDIGVPQMLGRDLKPFLTNAGEAIPLDDEAVAWYDEAQRAKAEGNRPPEKRGKFLRASGGDLHKRQMAALQKDGTGKDFDIIFTTYDQLNTVKGATTDRRRLVEGLAERAFIVLDESHNAGGTEASERAAKNAPESRSDFLKKVTGKAKAVMFSSATYAKRPGVMALYARTDMGKAVEKPEMLGALIERGGVPMQQVVAAMLAKAGQYIRRERSFDGVSYDVEPVSVDIKAYEAVSSSLSAIARFDINLKKDDAFKEIKEKLKEDAEAIGMDSGTGGASVNSTNFTSLMHNIVNQMLLAIKSDAVASRAIEALKNGEKPVITVANTMGAFLKTYAEDNGIKIGDAVDLSFRDVLGRYLERTRRLTIKRPDNTTYHYTIPLSALPSDLLAAYREAERLIREIDTTNLPISPIDWLRFRLQQAGYRVSEITGRKDTLEYGGPDTATFAQRMDAEVSPAGRRVNIDKFNRGDLDVMILNRAGSTGLSLHASSKFKDQRRRRMIIAQAELNIDVHMQMLGRVHRTGQVIPPAFVQAYADVPAEARPAAVLAKKMASLNANTTASRKSAFSADDSVDFLNEYGDQVAREFLTENPDINELLDVSMDPEKETARELTGRLLLLPVADQRRALEEITARYKVLIENLDAMGENALEAKTVDLGAKTIGRQELKPAEGDSPFTQAVILEETEVKAQGKALPLPEIIERAAEALGAGKVSTENVESALNELERVGRISKAAHFKKWFDDFDRMADDEIKVTKNEDLKTKRREAHTENRYRFARITDMVMPGRRVVVKAKDGSPLTGIVMKVSRRGQSGATGNPLALGAWSAEIAIPDNAQRITVPFSSLALPGDTVGEAERKVFIEEPDWANGIKQTVEAFENARKTGKETRYIVTGNILAGFDQTHGQGQIVNYTDDQGNVKPGILMSKTFSPKAFLDQRAVRFKTAAQVLAFLKKMPQAEISSHDDIITVRRADSWTEIEMPAARQSGGTYFLNPDVRKAAYDQFTKVGSRMRYKTNLDESVTRVLDAMMQAGAVFQTTEQQEVAEEIITGKKPDAPKQAPLSSRAQGRLSSAKGKPVFYSGLLKAVEGMKLDKAPTAQWMGSIRNTPGVKAEEIQWIGLEGWLAEQGGPVTKAEIADFIRANQVEVKEVVKERRESASYRDSNDYRDELWEMEDEELARELVSETGIGLEEAMLEVDVDRDQVIDDLVEEFEQTLRSRGADTSGQTVRDTTKFSKYQLPGGENYREILLTLPEKDAIKISGTIMVYADTDADGILTDISAEGLEGLDYGRETDPAGHEQIYFADLNPDDLAKFEEITTRNGGHLVVDKKLGSKATYRSGHFDEPNILAHVRFNERVVDGKRVLFIEEIQSDWHQTGRKHGYGPKLSNDEVVALVDERDGLSRVTAPGSFRREELTAAELQQKLDRIEEITRQLARSNGVPDAPFKTSWPELAMKRMIRWAAENGFDRIAWTPGEVQAERYDLSRDVNRIEWSPSENFAGQKYVSIFMRNGGQLGFPINDQGQVTQVSSLSSFADQFRGKTIDDVVGKEIGEKILKSPQGELKGEGLRVGGAGMKAFYDKILVDVANKLGKKFGTKVGKTAINVAGGKPTQYADFSAYERAVKGFGNTVHSLDIPPEMQAAAMEGQPLFKRREQAKVPTEPKPTKRNPYRFVISQKQTAALVHEIGQIAERILGHRLASISIVTDQEAWNETFGPEEDAVFDPNTGVIYLALHGTQDLRSTLRHEAVHALRQAGVIRAQEWAVLSRMAQTRWIDQYKIRGRYEALYRERFDISDAELEQLLIEEAVADAMAEHWMKAPTEDVVGRIFARIKAFLAAVRAMLLRRGYTSAEEIAAANQILENIERGGMSSRREGTGQGRDFMLYARQSEQAPLSSRRRLSPPRNPSPGSFEAPHDERVRRALADSTDTILNRLKRAGRAFGNEFRRKAQDREVDLLRTQNAIEATGGPLAEPQNAYLAASLYPGRVSQRDKDLVEDVIEPLVKDIARRGLSLEEVNDFVMARHAIERNLEVGQLHPPGSDFHEAMTNPAVVGASGMSENEANDILNDAQASGKFADLEAVGDEIVAMNRRTLAKLYSEGLITQDQYDALTTKYQYYVPLRGWDDVTDESNPDSPRTGRRYDVRGKEFQQAFGRSSKADSPLAYSILQARQAIIRIEKNRVGKRFLRLAQANPNEAFWEVNRVDLKKVIDPTTGYVRNVFDRGAAEAENVYAVKVGGKRYNITLHHEGLLRAMKGIGGENMGELVGVFHKINRFFAAINTSYDPEFIFRNFLRDIQQAGIVLQEERARGLARRVIASIPKAAYGMNKMLAGDLTSQWARFAREFADAGGKIGFMDRNDIDAEKRNLERLMKEATAGWTGKTLRAANEMTLERLARYNDTIENTLRLATYVQLRRAGATKDRAAFVARELTVNFNRKGEWGPALNAFYLFYNASMQGAASLFMRLARSRKMKMVAAGLIVEAFLMDMLNRMIGGDDDDDKNRYDKIPAEEKARNHIFMLPKWAEDKYGVPYFKVPLPLGWNWFNVVGQQASQAVAGVVTPLEAFGHIAGTFADSFNPLGSGGLLNTFAPTLLDPFVEIGTNRDFFNETIVPKQFDETTPYAERYKPNVNPAAKWLTDTLSSVTGGNSERAGGIDLSPEWVEHLADFTFGGLGRFFSRSMTTVDAWVSGEESDKGKVPFQRIFVGRDSTFADRDEYFQIRDAVHVTEKELKARIAEGNREAAAEVRRNHARELKMMNLMDTAEKQLTKLRKDYKAVKNAQKMGEAARAKRLEAISQRMDEIQRRVRTRWHQLGEDVETSPSSGDR